jgi:hypothetical protein
LAAHLKFFFSLCFCAFVVVLVAILETHFVTVTSQLILFLSSPNAFELTFPFGITANEMRRGNELQVLKPRLVHKKASLVADETLPADS